MCGGAVCMTSVGAGPEMELIVVMSCRPTTESGRRIFIQIEIGAWHFLHQMIWIQCVSTAAAAAADGQPKAIILVDSNGMTATVIDAAVLVAHAHTCV